MPEKRPSKIRQCLEHARVASERGTCLRRNYDAVIVKDDAMVSIGYTGAPRGAPNCIDLGKCEREQQNIPPGQQYELCRSVHAEANAIINAARLGTKVLGATLYLYGKDAKTGEPVKADLCKMCRRAIINAGIEKVIVNDPDAPEGYLVIYPKDLME